ncbi:MULTISPECIES: hypothetical protein [unclassified Hydrogenophaga]|uniref:hypothetical protein n=1 Tax=unclassified Hydrogenophaga TaxID=2610897 RepID=UPI000A8FF6D7|nr:MULTISPECIES: hypothetical protein [unclassified Hydrogenophaga]MBN9373037.1 hypothetical protein [Hydrogenophaga sp.]
MKKHEFLDAVNRRYGLVVSFQGDAPERLQNRAETGLQETFKQWCLRVLERHPKDVLVFGYQKVSPNTRLKSLHLGEDAPRFQRQPHSAVAEKLKQDSSKARQLQKEIRALERCIADLEERRDSLEATSPRRTSATLAELRDALGQSMEDGHYDELTMRKLEQFQQGLLERRSLSNLVLDLVSFADQNRRKLVRLQDFTGTPA